MSMSEPHHVLLRFNRPEEGKYTRLLGSIVAYAVAIPAVMVALIVLPFVVYSDKRFLRNLERHRQRDALRTAKRIARREMLGIEPWD